MQVSERAYEVRNFIGGERVGGDGRENVEAGMLGVNVGVAAPMAFFPFNGIKDSFYGDLHATGKDGVRFFTEHKVEVSRFLSEPETVEAVKMPTEAGP